MWAQLITMTLKPGKEAELPRLVQQFRDAEQAGSGLVRSTTMQDDGNPSRISFLVVFESEERARERENDPRREESLAAARATMEEIFEGAPEFVDFTIVSEVTP